MQQDNDISVLERAFRLSGFDVFLSFLLTAGAFGLLTLWTFPAPFPGESVRTIAELVGAWPRLFETAPIWHAIGVLCTGASPEETFQTLQLVACACVALSVGLFHNLSLRFLFGSQTEHSDPSWTPLFCRVGALAGTVVYLVLPPVWHAAQAPCAAALGLLLAALTLNLYFFLATRTAPPILLRLILPILAAVFLVESPIALALLPLLLLFHFTTELGIEKTSVSPDLDEEESQVPSPESQVPSPKPELENRQTGKPENSGPRAPRNGAPPSPFLDALLSTAQIVLFLGTVALGFHLMVRELQPTAALYRGASSYTATALLLLRDILRHLSASLPTAGTATLAALVLFPAVTIFAVARRSLSGDQRFTGTIVHVLVSLLILVETLRIPALSIWTLVPSASFQAAAALLLAQLFAPCVAAFFVQGRTLWLSRNANPDDAASGWEDPDRLDPRLYTGAARLLVITAVALVLVPFLRILACRELPTRAALSALDAYTRDLAASCGPCRYLISDGWSDIRLRLRRPDILPLPYTDSGEHLCPAPPEDRAVRSALLPDDYARALYADPAGWPMLLNDWLAFVPTNASATAIQTGFSCWYSTGRHRPGLDLCDYGLVLSALQPGTPGDLADAETWLERLRRLRGVHDPALATTLRAIQYRLDDFREPVFYTVAPADLPPLDFLDTLPPPAPHEAMRESVRDKGLTTALAADLFAITRAASRGGATPEKLSFIFNALLARIRKSEPALPEVERRIESAWQESELENAPVDPSARILDLVHAYLLLRCAHDPEGARALLEPYEHDLVLDPAFWYVWGLCKIADRNSFGILQSQEMLEKFPDHSVLRSLLDATEAVATANADKEAASINAALSSLPGDLFLLRRLLRNQLVTGPTELLPALEATAPYALRILRVDAADPLAHLILGLLPLARLSVPPEPGAPPRPADAVRVPRAVASEHLRRALDLLPPFTVPLFRPLAEAIDAGRAVEPGDLPTVSELIDADRAVLRTAPPTHDVLFYHLGLILQHFDPAAKNNRYLIDPI